MADWNTVTLVPSMRCSSCPSIRGSHWSKFFSNPARYRSIFFKASAAEHTIYVGRFPALTEMALQEGERCSVAEVHGQLGVDLSLQLHQLPDPVARQEGEVWETLVNRASDEGIRIRKRHQHEGGFEPDGCSAWLPDGDHLPLYGGGVQLPHAADVVRPLELL